MNWVVFTLAALLLLSLAILVFVVFFAKQYFYEKAMGALLAIFAGVVAALHAPSAEGNADIVLSFGSLGYIRATILQVNPHESLVMWICVLVSVMALFGLLLFMLHAERMALIHRGKYP